MKIILIINYYYFIATYLSFQIWGLGIGSNLHLNDKHLSSFILLLFLYCIIIKIYTNNN